MADFTRPEALPFRPPSTALAWSETRLELLDAGENVSSGPHLALWRPRGMTVALGIGQNAEIETHSEEMLRDDVALIRRQSGGGAVLLFPGVLCWEAWADLSAIERLSGGGAWIRESYEVLSAPVRFGLAGLHIEAFQAGISDLSCRMIRDEGEEIPDRENVQENDATDSSGWVVRKLAGTAQLRKRRSVLVHGSLLVTADVDALPRYLAMPSSMPEYRSGRTHRDFCVTVKECLNRRGVAYPDEDLMRLVGEKIAAAALSLGWTMQSIPRELPPEAARLEQAKYQSTAWNREKRRNRPVL